MSWSNPTVQDIWVWTLPSPVSCRTDTATSVVNLVTHSKTTVRGFRNRLVSTRPLSLSDTRCPRDTSMKAVGGGPMDMRPRVGTGHKRPFMPISTGWAHRSCSTVGPRRWRGPMSA
jgi:hypothetical protein